MMDLFEDFLIRKAPGGKEESPFLAVRRLLRTPFSASPNLDWQFT